MRRFFMFLMVSWLFKNIYGHSEALPDDDRLAIEIE